MLSTTSDGNHYLAPTVVESVKILVVGSFGVGKTTLIGSVSEIEPLRTEETITAGQRGDRRGRGDSRRRRRPRSRWTSAGSP